MKNSIDIILSRCQEVGECLEWPTSWVPQVRIETALPAKPGAKRKPPFYVRNGLWETLHERAVPDGFILRSTCYNPRCVSPEHLRVSSRLQAVRAAHKAGRHERTASTQALATKARRAQSNIKLSEGIAEFIRLSDERPAVLAERYGVDKSLINRIRAGKAWRPVTTGYSIFSALVAA